MRLGLLAAIMLLIPALSIAWDPPGWTPEPKAASQAPVDPVSASLGLLLDFYRGNVSPIDDTRCPSHPSCSAYSKEAIHLHGPLLGAVLTASRLVSEADEAAFSHRVRIDGADKVYYPVEETFILEEKLGR